MRPSSSELLAAQLEAASLSRKTPASPSTNGPNSPSTPWLSDSFSFNSITSSPTSSPEIPRRKFVSRGPTARADADADVESDLEDELADFGYGAHKKKQPTESLLDLLNSAPPGGWPDEQPPSTPQTPRKMSVLQKKLRLGSRQSTTDEPAPSTRGFSTLRSFRSSSSLLGLSKSNSIQISDPIYDISQPHAASTRLAAKEAAPRGDSTSELATFLRLSSPPRLSHSSSISTTSSAHTSIDGGSGVTSNAKILQAVVAKVGAEARRASLIRSGSGSSLHQSNVGKVTPPEVTPPGARSMFDTSMKSHVLASTEDEEALHESVSSFAAQSRLSRQMSSTTAISSLPRPVMTTVKTSPGQLQRSDSLLISPVTSPTAKRRVSRKPPPSVDEIDLVLPRSPPRPTKQLISDDTLRLLGQKDDDAKSTCTKTESPVKGRTPLPDVPDFHRTSSATFGSPRQPNFSSDESSTSSVASVPNTDLPQPPPPQAPLPLIPNRSASRPTSLLLANTGPWVERSNFRWSTISYTDTIRRAPTPELALQAEVQTIGAEDPIVSAMRRLQRSMQEAAELSLAKIPPMRSEGGVGLSTRRVEALMPMLKVLGAQMKEAASMIDLVVQLAEGGEEEGKEFAAAEGAVVEQLLGAV